MQGPQALARTIPGVGNVGNYQSDTEILTSKLPHGVGQAVPLNGCPDLLTAGSDVERSLGLETLGQGLLHQTGHTGHVLVAGVGAGTDQAVLDLQWPAVVLDYKSLKLTKQLLGGLHLGGTAEL